MFCSGTSLKNTADSGYSILYSSFVPERKLCKFPAVSLHLAAFNTAKKMKSLYSAGAGKWLCLSLCIAVFQPACILATGNASTSSSAPATTEETFSPSSEAASTPASNSSKNVTIEAVFEPQIITYGNNTCESYTVGDICSPVLTPFPDVLTNLSRSSDQTSAAATVETILTALSQFNAPRYCTEAVIPLLCRYTFPTCDPAYRVPTYQPICRRDCEIVRDFLCREPWAAMLKLLALLDFQYLDQPDCEPLGNTEAGDSPMCINTLSKDVIARPLYTGSCYSGKGRGYQGNISVTESGYTCQSWSKSLPHQHLLGYENYEELSGEHNFCRNPGERGKRPWCFTTNSTKRWEYCDVPQCAPGPMCVSHQFSVCRLEGTIGMDWVYVDTSVIAPDLRANGTQSALQHISQSGGYSESCRAILTEYLCILNFPSCDLSSNEPRPIMPCRSFCERVQSVCGDEIMELRSFNNLFKSVLFSTDCGAMPEPSGGDAPECYEQTRTLSSASTASLVETECFNSTDLGVSYRGNLSVTSSGKVCQSWLSQEPHPHAVTPVDRPELVGHNHCRNPDARGSRTWCYTMDPSTRWEYCDIPACGDAAKSGTSTQTIIIAVVVPVCVFLLIVLLFLLACVCCAQRRSKLAKMELKRPAGGTVTTATCPVYTKSPRNALELSDNPLYAANSLAQDPANFDGLKLPEFPRENIFYIKDLGQGHFGVVVQAEAIGIDPGKEKSTVAIKVMKEGASTQTKKEFFREASLMHTFDHPNIVKLLGVCINQEPLCMIFEFMELGDLNQFLRQSAPRQGGGGGGMSSLSTQQLVYMAIDIAAGLEYLAQNHFVHRDLATRNCLVSRDLHIKISDFGLSQDVYTTDYFKMGDTELLPIRWMPPEAILYAKFTVQSDIWSFGVVMWEIFSFGIQPYFSLTNEEVVQHVRNGKVLSCPEGCPQDIYDLIMDCWVMDPAERPTAGEIHDGLRRWSPEQTGLASVNGNGHPSYQNVATVQGYANPGAVDSPVDKYDHLEMSGLDSLEENHDATKESTIV